MMGADVERVVAGIDAVKKAAQDAIVSFSNVTAYQLISRAEHAGTAGGPCAPEEIEVPGGNPMSGVTAAMSGMSDDCGKMESLGGSLYTSTASFNNSLGSPWAELSNLQSAVSAAESYSGSHSPFNYVGEKAGMLAMLNMVMSAAVDAKWAIITYHDYLQRGYDESYNGKKPSITFQETIDSETTGNLIQDFDENVRVPTPSIDPF